VGLDEELSVAAGVCAGDGGLVRQRADQDRRIVEVGSGSGTLPIAHVRKLIEASELCVGRLKSVGEHDVLDKLREILRDDSIVREVIPIPLLHGVYYDDTPRQRYSAPG
jgi:hypothetical protein